MGHRARSRGTGMRGSCGGHAARGRHVAAVDDVRGSCAVAAHLALSGASALTSAYRGDNAPSMFRLPDGQLVLSATDLTSFLACEHLIEQKRAVSLAERTRWRKTTDPHGDLARTRGMQHELEQEE